MSPLSLFAAVEEKGVYTVGYIQDGWTCEVMIEASKPTELLTLTQNKIGDICNVVYVEKY